MNRSECVHRLKTLHTRHEKTPQSWIKTLVHHHQPHLNIVPFIDIGHDGDFVAFGCLYSTFSI